MTIKKLLSLALYYFLFSQLYTFGGEGHAIAVWPVSERLSQSTIINVFNGQDGMLWITTLDGITRFDGNNLLDYSPRTPNDGFIASTSILKVFEGKSGTIYAATRDSGIHVYDGSRNSFFALHWNQTKPTLDDEISSAFSSPDGTIWIGYEGGSISRISPDVRVTEHFDNLSRASISDFTQDSLGRIFAANSVGEVYGFGKNKDTPERLSAIEKCDEQFSVLVEIAAVGDDFIWLGTRGNGLFYLDLNNAKCQRFELNDVEGNISTNASVNQIVYDYEKGITWVGTDQGLYAIGTDSAITHYHTNNSSLANNEIISFFKGENEIYWVGTFSGLNYLVTTGFESFVAERDANLHSIVAIDSSERQGVWIASYNGLLHLDPPTQTHFKSVELHPDRKFTNKKIMSLHADSDGLWVGYRSSGLEFYSIRDDEVLSFQAGSEGNLSSNSITTVLTIAGGKTLVGTYGGGLNIISHKGAIEVYTFADNRVIMLYETSDGLVWVGTESALYRFDLGLGKLNEISVDKSFYSNRTKPIIWNMAEAPNGDLWLGTMHHGLFIWRKDDRKLLDMSKITPFEQEPNPVGTIYAIQIDDLGYIWCSSNVGLIQVEPLSGNRKTFSKQHGLHHTEFDFGVSHKDSKGNLYFGGSKGYIRFNPINLDLKSPTPQLRFTNIDFGQSIRVAPNRLVELKNLHLTHHDYFVTFEFSVLDFIDPDKNQFRYMLVNFDPDWIESGTRNTATYTNLPPGDYVLQVQGANSAGIWNREGLSLNVHVAPPPWRTWWAYCIYALAFLFFIWILKRVYDSYVVERKASQMAVEMHEAENRSDDDMQEQLELQDDLVKSAYRHNLATLALVSECISHQAEPGTDQPARESIESSIKRIWALSKLEECFYFEIDGPSADLHKYTDIILSDLLSDSPVPAESITTINEVTTRRLPAELASQLSIIIFEMLENCVQHAFTPDSAANYIQVNLDIDPVDSIPEQHYRLTVRDSGMGLPEQLDLINPQTSGLSIVRAIVKNLAGTLHISSDNGTTASFAFPVFGEMTKPDSNATAI